MEVYCLVCSGRGVRFLWVRLGKTQDQLRIGLWSLTAFSQREGNGLSTFPELPNLVCLIAQGSFFSSL